QRGRVRAQREHDLRAGAGWVELPDAPDVPADMTQAAELVRTLPTPGVPAVSVIQTLAAVFGRYTRTVQISLGERQAAKIDISKTCSRDSGGRRHDDEDRVRGAGGRRGRGGGHAGPQLMRASRNRPDLALRSSSTP